MTLVTARLSRVGGGASPLLLAACAFGFVTDFFNKIPLAGGLSLAGAISALFAVLILIHCLSAVRLPRHLVIPAGMQSGFLLLAVTVSLVSGLPISGVQNLVTYTAFIGALYASAALSLLDPGFPLRLMRLILRLSLLLATTYLVLVLVLGPGHDLVFAPRSTAMILLLGVAISVAATPWTSPYGAMRLLLLLVAIGASLSRMALLTALLLIALSSLRRGTWSGWLLLLGSLGGLGGLFLWLTIVIPVLRSRMMEGDAAVQVGGITLNTSGRDVIWAHLLAKAQMSPWIGHGAGSSGMETKKLFLIAHAHNDYLRFFYDFGLIGFLLFMIPLLFFIRWNYRRGLQDGNIINRVAFLSGVGLLCMMVTDIPVVFFGLMMGVALLNGAGSAAIIRQHGS